LGIADDPSAPTRPTRSASELPRKRAQAFLLAVAKGKGGPIQIVDFAAVMALGANCDALGVEDDIADAVEVAARPRQCLHDYVSVEITNQSSLL
jgi:hypothetical protein